METVEPRLNKRPRGWLAAGGRGGGRRRRGGQRVGGAGGSSGRRLEEGGGRPRPQAPPRLGVSPAAGGWMGLLQAVAAAAKVAAVAAAAAVSAASINHLPSPGPFWDEGLPRCPLSPFSPSPPPPQSTARKTLNFRGGAAARFPPAGARAAEAHAQLPSAPRPRSQPGLVLWQCPRLAGWLEIRCGVSVPDPVRLRPFLLSASGPGRGGAKLPSPLWLRLCSPASWGSVPARGRLLLALQPWW